jgi:Rieske Fe-S protein
MGCAVHWNEAETTWDCPCHGSRFGADGALINGPAVHGLEQVALVPVTSPAPGMESALSP